MASQLALVFAQQLRVPVRITDLSQDRVDAALHWIGDQLDKLVVRGRLDVASAAIIRALVTGGADKTAFADCDVVIEAVFEEIDVKRAVFAELEPILRPDALLLTNTSSLSIEAMGAGLAHPERLIDFHFFNPVAVLPLVEIIATPQTDEITLASAFELARHLRKTAVLVKDTAGFVVNRVLTRLFNEMLSMLDDGADPDTVDHSMDPLGLPMTPLRLLQFIGPAVQLHICKKMHQTYPERFSVSTSLTRLVAAGLPGYLDDGGGISPAAASLLPASKQVDAGVVRTRILAALAEEVTAMTNKPTHSRKCREVPSLTGPKTSTGVCRLAEQRFGPCRPAGAHWGNPKVCCCGTDSSGLDEILESVQSRFQPSRLSKKSGRVRSARELRVAD